MCQDTNTFLELLKPQYNDALKYCKALCSNRSLDDAEDVLQQSFLKALEKFETLKDKDKFRSWFFKIITREFFNLIRKNFWKRFLPLDASYTQIRMPEVFERIDEEENKAILHKALSMISSKERSAILLFEVEGFSIEEIKQIQNEKSISAVKSRLSRARKKLKKYFIETEKNNLNSLSKNTMFSGDINNETIKLITETERK